MHFVQFRYCTSHPSSKPRLEGPGSELPWPAGRLGPATDLEPPAAGATWGRAPRGRGGARGTGQCNCEVMFPERGRINLGGVGRQALSWHTHQLHQAGSRSVGVHRSTLQCMQFPAPAALTGLRHRQGTRTRQLSHMLAEVPAVKQPPRVKRRKSARFSFTSYR